MAASNGESSSWTDPTRHESSWVVIGLFAIAASTLLVEIALTKFIAYKVYHHYAYAIISVVIFGFGAAGAYVFIRPEVYDNPQRPSWPKASAAAAQYSLCLIAAILFFCWVPLDPYSRASAGYASLILPLYFVILVIPFFFAGICVSYTLCASRRSVMRIYFWDLLGAAVGASLCPLLLPVLGGYGTIVAASGLGMLACYAYGRVPDARGVVPGTRRRDWIAWVPAASLCLLYPQWAASRYGFDIQSSKDLSHREVFKNDFHGIEFTNWNAIARVDVSHLGRSTNPMYRYGLSPLDAHADIPGRYILVDGGANTRQFQAIGPIAEQHYLGNSLWASPYVAHGSAKKSLVIGGGGGIDILVAKYFATSEVDVAELNPANFALLIGTPKDPDRDLYLPWIVTDDVTRVEVFNSEARHFSTTRPPETYDIIQASGVDTLTAITTGGKSLVENYLYTLDAVRDYTRLLKPDGILSLTHWRRKPTTMALRMFLTYLEYLEQNGVTEPWRHVVVIGSNAWTDTMLKKTPFTPEEIEKLRRWADKAGYAVLFDPLLKDRPIPEIDPSEQIYQKVGFSSAQQRRKSLADYRFDVAPVSDDSPYFYRLRKGTGLASGFSDPNVFSIFITALCGAVLLILLPMFRIRRREVSAAVVCYSGFFALCGFAFMLFEIAILQMFTIFVGGPTYSLAVVLVCVLAGYAVGSWLTELLRPERRTFIALGIGLGALFGGLYFILPATIQQLMPLTHTGRMFASGAITLAVSVCVAMPVTLAMASVRRSHGSVVGWMWAISSAFNVLGAISFVPLTQVFGISAALLLVAALYVVANVGFSFSATLEDAAPDGSVRDEQCVTSSALKESPDEYSGAPQPQTGVVIPP